MDKKSLVSISDLSKEEIVGLLNKAAEFEKNPNQRILQGKVCLLYTSDAADE